MTARPRRVWHRERSIGCRVEIQTFLDAWEGWTEAPFPIVVLPGGGLRTDEAAQRLLYNLGRTKAKTLADTPHGRGAAVDVAPFRRNANGLMAADFANKGDFERIGEFAEDLGLSWGGRFRGFFDGPHVEIPNWRSLPHE